MVFAEEDAALRLAHAHRAGIARLVVAVVVDAVVAEPLRRRRRRQRAGGDDLRCAVVVLEQLVLAQVGVVVVVVDVVRPALVRVAGRRSRRVGECGRRNCVRSMSSFHCGISLFDSFLRLAENMRRGDGVGASHKSQRHHKNAGLAPNCVAL